MDASEGVTAKCVCVCPTLVSEGNTPHGGFHRWRTCRDKVMCISAWNRETLMRTVVRIFVLREWPKKQIMLDKLRLAATVVLRTLSNYHPEMWQYVRVINFPKKGGLLIMDNSIGWFLLCVRCLSITVLWDSQKKKKKKSNSQRRSL